MNEHNIVTIPLSTDALNWDLALKIMEDCRQACEPSSYRTTRDTIFARPDLASKETCMVIALPGISSADVPPSTEQPDALVLRGRPDGRGTAYLELRSGQVLLETYTLGLAEPGSQYYVLYLFEDGSFLDVIPATETLQEDMWIHEMNAQSRHPVDDGPDDSETAHAFELPVVIKRALNVTKSESNSDNGDEEPIPF
jgi:hypothetical protein